MIVTAHPPGYLPGVSVMAKVAAADKVIWLDTARYTTPGYINRNELPDGTWLTVPVERRTHRDLIRDVVIGADRWAVPHVEALEARYADAPHFDRMFLANWQAPLTSPGEPLVTLNVHLIRAITARLGIVVAHSLASAYDATRAHVPLSVKIARMVKEAGGDTYLSGPTSRLDLDAFAREGVRVAYFEFTGSNPSVVDPLFRCGVLPADTGQRQTVHEVSQ